MGMVTEPPPLGRHLSSTSSVTHQFLNCRYCDSVFHLGVENVVPTYHCDFQCFILVGKMSGGWGGPVNASA